MSFELKPVRTEYDVGVDRYGRRVRLIKERCPGPSPEWRYAIEREAANQLDESQCVRDLTKENILDMVRAVQHDRA